MNEKDIQLANSLRSSLKFKQFQQHIGHQFTNFEVVATALTHSSYSNECAEDIKDYEKLEFLGDALLQVIVTEELVTKYPEEKEGNLSKLRSSIVNEEALAKVAMSIGLGEFIFLGKGEDKSGGRTRYALLADVMESFIAAIYLDTGFERAKEMTLSLLKRSSENLFDIRNIIFFDAKTKLQEFTLKRFKSLPEYETNELSLENGMAFEVKLNLQDHKIFRAIDISKKKAQQQVAAAALNYIENNNFLAQVSPQE